MKSLALLVVLCGVSKGGPLYIRGASADLCEKPDCKGPQTALKGGEAVTWNGPAKDGAMHEVVYKGKKGYLPVTALTPNREAVETTDAAVTVSAFTTQTGGAPRKGFEAPFRRSGNDAADAALLVLRASSEHAKADVAAHDKQVGGAP